jgi:hypothetical protein
MRFYIKLFLMTLVVFSNSLYSQTGPAITGVSLASDNSYIDVTFDKGVYDSNGGSGALKTDDFTITISSGPGFFSSITSVKTTAGANLSGGESTIRIYFNTYGSINPSQTITVVPKSSTSIYDVSGNAASTTQSNNSTNLNKTDNTAPTISRTFVNSSGSSGWGAASLSGFEDNLYGSSNGTGSINTSDFTISMTGGTATNISLTYVSHFGLEGIFFEFSFSGTADGNEVVTINPVANSVFDGAGNAMSSTQSNNTGNLTDQTGAYITGVSLASDNSYIDVTFDESTSNNDNYWSGLGALETDDFTITISSGPGFFSSITSVKTTAGANLSGGESTIRIYFNTYGSINPSQTITVVPASATSIYDDRGNAASTTQSNNSTNLNKTDNTAPTISRTFVNSSGSSGWGAASLSGFEDNLYGSSNGTGSINTSDFTISMTGGTATNISLTYVSHFGLEGIFFEFSFSGTADGNEVVTINPVANSVFDGAGNAMSSTQSNNTGNLTDQTGAYITGVSLASDNSYIDVTFDESTSNNDNYWSGLGALETDDFSLSISGGVAASPTITSVTKTDNNSLSGGESTIRINFSVTGTPNGSEVLSVVPASSTSIYDDRGNAASTTQSNNSVNLNSEATSPYITGVNIATDNSYVDVTFDVGVYNTNGGSGALEGSDFSLALSGGTATNPSVTSVTKNDNTALAGGETVIRINFSVTGTPDGDEVLTVTPAPSSIFESGGDAASTTQSNNTVNLIATIASAPTLTAPSDNATNQIINAALTWSTVTGATSYNVELATDNSFSNIVCNLTPSSNSAQASGLSYSTTYYYRVRGTNAGGDGPWSSTFSFSTVVNYALKFDGSNDYVTVPNSSDFEFSTGTIEFWVKPSWSGSHDSNPCMVGMRVNGSTRFSFHMQADKSGFGMYNGSAYNTKTYAFSNDTWYHIAYVFSGSNTEVFVNGVSQGTLGNLPNTGVTGRDFTIGWSNDSGWPTESFPGYFDELRVWNVVRSQSDISNNMNNPGLDPSTTGLVAYYHFDDGAPSGSPKILPGAGLGKNSSPNDNIMSSTLTDATPNSHNGSLSNFPASPWTEASNNPLPVELISFTAANTDGEVLLNWQTATEVNNYGFEVERASITLSPTDSRAESREWESIGFVQGHGNSNSPKSYEYIDETPPAGNLEYRLKQIDTDGSFNYYNTTVSVNAITSVEEFGLPDEYFLNQNYPNPFNPSSVISYQLPEVSTVQLKVYDMLGKEVAELVNKQQQPGYYQVTFNADKSATGLYIYKLIANDFVATKKMMLIK